ncbi:hypothetical protein MK079_00210 [Candidatus Gracilibacteria bacterium]|nr:hypothetical protein [Candidatus Gracilibacteria bacterium]
MKEKILKGGKIFLISILGIFILLECYHIFVDTYNFRQLEKAKPILESIPLDAKTFYSLEEFNDQYNAEIKPVNNCYIVSNYSGREPYIFGFKLESYLYIYIYGTQYYAYPKYDVPYGQKCVGGIGCYDRNWESFQYIVSHPCETSGE